MTRNKEIPAAELEKRSARFMELFMRGPSGCCNWPWGTGTPRPFHAAVRGRLPGWSPYGALRADAAGSLPARLPATDTIRRICDALPLDAVIADMPGWEDEIRAIRDTLRKSAVPWWAFARKDCPLRWVWCSVEPVHAKAEPSFLVLELAPELDDAADLPALLALGERMDPAEEERLKARWFAILPCDIWKMPPEEVVKTAVMLNRHPDLRSFDTPFTFPSVRHVREGLWWETA